MHVDRNKASRLLSLASNKMPTLLTHQAATRPMYVHLPAPKRRPVKQHVAPLLAELRMTEAGCLLHICTYIVSDRLNYNCNLQQKIKARMIDSTRFLDLSLSRGLFRSSSNRGGSHMVTHFQVWHFAYISYSVLGTSTVLCMCSSAERPRT